jgi:uncharacterized protein YlxW (UPF0749 family)
MADEARRVEGPQPAGDPPRQTHMGLLDYVAATSLDEDYTQLARRRAASASPPPRGGPGWTAIAVLAVFGLLVATAAVRTSRDSDQSAISRATLVKQADARKEQLNRSRTLVRQLQGQIAALEAKRLDETTQGRVVQEQLNRLGVLTGGQATRGPGVVGRVDDAPHATSSKQQVQAPDLQKLVNGLWQVGAEAISINGQRLTSLSAIRDAAGSITVNFVSLRRPYVVSAIGDPGQLGAQLLDTAGGQAWATLQSTFGLQFDVNIKDSMVLPAARRLTLRSAHAPEARR